MLALSPDEVEKTPTVSSLETSRRMAIAGTAVAASLGLILGLANGSSYGSTYLTHSLPLVVLWAVAGFSSLWSP